MPDLSHEQKLKLFYYLCRVYTIRNGKRVLVRRKGGCGCGK